VKARTRISLHVSDKKPCIGDKVSFSGYLQAYDSELKRWDPLKGKLTLVIDGEKVKTFSSNNYGYFEVEYKFYVPKKYDVEVRYNGSPKTKACSASIKIEALTEKQKNRIKKIVRLFTLLVILMLILISLIFILFSFKP